jgi:hypothetical protein
MPDEVTPKEVGYWQQEYAKCKQLREPFERQWYLNLAFYNGKQYVSWIPNNSVLSNQRLMDPPAPRYRVRYVGNKVRPAVRMEIAKLTKEEPQFYVVPSTTEPTDVMAAEVSEAIAEYILDAAKFNVARRRAAFWMSICGTSFISTYILPDTGEDPAFCNIAYDDVTPFHIFIPNPQEQNIEKQPYVIRERTVHVDKIQEQYGMKINPSMVTTLPVDQRFLQAIGIRNQSGSADMVNMWDIWIKPCVKYPQGGYIVLAGSKIVYVEPPIQDPTLDLVDKPLELMPFSQTSYPYGHGMFPFAKSEHIPSGGFYGLSIIDDMIAPQRVYNRQRSSIIESSNLTSKPQLVYTKGSIDPNKITSEPGLLIPVNPGFDAPHYLDTKAVSSYEEKNIELTLSDLDDAAGQYEVTKGRTPPGVEAASAIAYLQEENDSRLHTTIASIEEMTTVIGVQTLSLVQEFWDPQKILAVVSKAGALETVQFTAANIKGGTDIRVETGSMAPKSRTARQAFITELMKLGLIPPEKGLRYLEMSETNRLYEELQVDSKQARRENVKMAQMQQMMQQPMGMPGQGLSQGPQMPGMEQPQQPQMPGMMPQQPQPLPVFPINPWDNNDIHLYEHGLYMKSQEFETLPNEVKQVFIQHYMLTEQAILGAQYGAGVPGAADNSGGAEQPGQLPAGQPAPSPNGAVPAGDAGGGVPAGYS